VEGLLGRVGGPEAERLMSDRVYAAIGKQYPELLAECVRQLGLRTAASFEPRRSTRPG
jgi:hypothetical protein